MSFKNKKIAVIGAGVEGISSLEYLVSKGAKVTVLDKKEVSNEETEKLRKGGIEVKTGKDYLESIDQYDFVVRSPGIKRNLPEIIAAEKRGIGITSQTKLFFDLCPAKIIGVTGTKGKGTTSSLIYEMLKAAGFDVYLGGNIGRSPFEFLDKLNTHAWVVLELSSFQLQDVDKSPHIAVMLMVTQEHLNAWGDQNYHESIEEYVDAKRNILRFQTSSDFAVINRDYLASNESAIHTDGKVFKVSRERECEEGCFIRGNKIILRLPRKFQISNFKFQINNESSPRQQELEIISTKEILFPGKHNWENVCAAVMAAALAGVSKKSMISVLKTFKGLEHRLELVREVGGIKYYDDSFSTTPETAIAAIEAFEAPEILILGGSSKNSDFTELGKVISAAPNIKAIIGIGKEWERIKSRIQNSKFKIVNTSDGGPAKGGDSSEVGKIPIIEGCKSMKEIVLSAWEIAEPGDVVLLSPACASFGMFKNYKDRGEQFKKEVNNLLKTHELQV